MSVFPKEAFALRVELQRLQFRDKSCAALKSDVILGLWRLKIWYANFFFFSFCGKLVQKRGLYVPDLFVINADSGERLSASVRSATENDVASTGDWQTD